MGDETPRATAPSGDYVLILTCPDRPGVVHAVSGFLVRHGGNIVESQQFGDRLTGRFFMRMTSWCPAPARSRSAWTSCAATSPTWRPGST